MASLAHAIRSFQSGDLTPNDFFAEIDQVLATDQANAGRMLAILNEEHTNYPLPPDVYVEVQRRIENRDQVKWTASSEETRLQTNAGNHAKAAPPTSSEQSGGAPEPIKGVGDTLNGRFVLEECLGFGGMGMVFRALDLRKLEAADRNPYIAIKVLNVQFRGHPKSLIALQREAKKAQALAHPNIVTVYDFDRDGAMVYLTMEYLSGNPLSQLLRTEGFKGMPYAEALPIISGMSKALAYAHERGFVHCDFKPANVFLTASGDVKVIDFGIARLIPKPEEEVEATVFDPGSLGGMTPAYASPEMLEHGEPDPRDDIYALACITYELLSGHHPFDRLPANQARGKRMRPERPSGLGRRQWQALRAALSFERGTRTPTVARFIHGMSGERPAGAHLVGAGAALLLAVLVAATIAHYQPFANHQGGEPTTAAPQTPLATVQPTATPGVATPASVASILASVPCSLLRASERDNTLLVRGYLPRYFGIPRLKEMLSAAPGVSHLNLDVRQVSDDDCGVITALAPYWSRNQEDGSATSIRPRGRNAELSEGDSLILDITTPPYDAYVNVDYYVLDGSVVHLLPSPRAKDNQTPPSYAATLGSLGNWIVSKPFGSELIVLLVTPVPLFDGIRPEHESRSNYLEAIEKRLGQIASKYGPEHITADFVLLTTKPKP